MRAVSISICVAILASCGGDPVPAEDAGRDAPLLDASPTDALMGILDVPSLRAPVLGARTGSAWANGSRRPTFAWTPITSADGYELVVDDSCDAPNGAECELPTPEVRERTDEPVYTAVADLPIDETPPVGRRYFWRVRACASDGACSEWSALGYLDVGRLAADYDGDGYSDVVAGAPRSTSTATSEGHVVVWRGSASGVETAPACRLRLPAPEEDARFGSIVASAGDVNADGFDDLLVSAPRWDGGVIDSGVVLFYAGGTTGVCGASPTNVRASAPEAGAELGDAVAGAGDVDGDGHADVVVGARFTDGGSTDEGAAFLLRGSLAGVEGALELIGDPAPEALARFGGVVQGIGDVNGDAFADVAVTSPFASAPMPESGRVIVLHGSPSGLALAATIDNPDEESAHGYFGSAAFGVDLDGDLVGDLVVGANEQAHPEGNEGNAFVYFGDTSGVARVPGAWLDNPEDKRAGRFGRALAAGDFGAGVELVVTAQYQGIGGSAFIYGSGPRVSETPRVEVENPDAQFEGRFGISAASTDVNGDGLADLLVGADAQSSPATNEGNVFVYMGGPGGVRRAPDLRLEDTDDRAGARLGTSVR